MSAPIRFGHCPCGAAIPVDQTMCRRCELGSCEALYADVRRIRRGQLSWDRRHDAAIRLYLLAIVLAVVMAAPTIELGLWPNGFLSLFVVALVAGLGALVHPRDRRPR